MFWNRQIAGCTLVLALSFAAKAQTQPSMLWTTLGTNGGPIAFPGRSEPANLLQIHGKPWLVDCGDGATERLAQVGLHATDIDVVFISHLHMDHIGGLQGLMGLRWMVGAQTPLIIYGPPGTQQLVDGIIQSMQPSATIAVQESMRAVAPDKMVKVIIIQGGGDLMIGGVRIRAVQNSHFNDATGHAEDNGSQALSYRFDFQGESITYTGDTGPSEAVTKLARGSDLLVSEVIDREAMNAMVQHDPHVPEGAKKQIINHFNTQHLSPQEAGEMAGSADVKRLIFTHLATDQPTYLESPKLIAGAREKFKGTIVVARDLDQF